MDNPNNQRSSLVEDENEKTNHCDPRFILDSYFASTPKVVKNNIDIEENEREIVQQEDVNQGSSMGEQESHSAVLSSRKDRMVRMERLVQEEKDKTNLKSFDSNSAKVKVGLKKGIRGFLGCFFIRYRKRSCCYCFTLVPFSLLVLGIMASLAIIGIEKFIPEFVILSVYLIFLMGLMVFCICTPGCFPLYFHAWNCLSLIITNILFYLTNLSAILSFQFVFFPMLLALSRVSVRFKIFWFGLFSFSHIVGLFFIRPLTLFSCLEHALLQLCLPLLFFRSFVKKRVENTDVIERLKRALVLLDLRELEEYLENSSFLKKGPKCKGTMEDIVMLLKKYKLFLPRSLWSKYVKKKNEVEIKRRFPDFSYLDYSSYQSAKTRFTEDSKNTQFQMYNNRIRPNLESKEVSVMSIEFGDGFLGCETGYYYSSEDLVEIVATFLGKSDSYVEKYKGVILNISNGKIIVSFNTISVCRETEKYACFVAYKLNKFAKSNQNKFLLPLKESRTKSAVDFSYVVPLKRSPRNSMYRVNSSSGSSRGSRTTTSPVPSSERGSQTRRNTPTTSCSRTPPVSFTIVTDVMMCGYVGEKNSMMRYDICGRAISQLRWISRFKHKNRYRNILMDENTMARARYYFDCVVLDMFVEVGVTPTPELSRIFGLVRRRKKASHENFDESGTSTSEDSDFFCCSSEGGSINTSNSGSDRMSSYKSDRSHSEEEGGGCVFLSEEDGGGSGSDLEEEQQQHQQQEEEEEGYDVVELDDLSCLSSKKGEQVFVTDDEDNEIRGELVESEPESPDVPVVVPKSNWLEKYNICWELYSERRFDESLHLLKSIFRSMEESRDRKMNTNELMIAEVKNLIRRVEKRTETAIVPYEPMYVNINPS